MIEPGRVLPATSAVAPPGEPERRPELPTQEEIFRTYAPRVYSRVRRMLGNEADAEDVTQDIFVQVLRYLPIFRGEAAFPTWLFRIAVNAPLAYRRKRALRKAQPLAEPFEDFAENGEHRGFVRRWAAGPEQLTRIAHRAPFQSIINAEVR